MKSRLISLVWLVVVQVAEQGIPRSWSAVLALVVLALHRWMERARPAVETRVVRELAAGPHARRRRPWSHRERRPVHRRAPCG